MVAIDQKIIGMVRATRTNVRTTAESVRTIVRTTAVLKKAASHATISRTKTNGQPETKPAIGRMIRIENVQITERMNLKIKMIRMRPKFKTTGMTGMTRQ